MLLFRRPFVLDHAMVVLARNESDFPALEEDLSMSLQATLVRLGLAC
jgi:hypothetical protein